MKIALIGRFGEGERLSGPERVARELYYELRSKNDEVVFIEYFFSGYRNNTILKKIFGNETLNDNVRRLGIIPLILFLLIKKFDLLHIINLQRYLLSIIPLKLFLPFKIVTTFHGLIKNEIPQKNYFKKKYFLDILIEKLLIKKSDLMVFPSNLLIIQFKKNYWLAEKKVRIIPNGVSKNFLENKRQFPAIENSIKLVFYNGIDNSFDRGLYKLLFLLEKVKYNIELCIIGGQEILNHSSKINLNYQVSMSHNQLKAFLVDKHFVIKSSNLDSFSIFVVECMSIGLIPLISENVGIKDIIRHKENGFVYNSESSDVLTNLLNEIAEGKYDLSTISANAKETARKLDWSIITEQYISEYNSII